MLVYMYIRNVHVHVGYTLYMYNVHMQGLVASPSTAKPSGSYSTACHKVYHFLTEFVVTMLAPTMRGPLNMHAVWNEPGVCMYIYMRVLIMHVPTCMLYGHVHVLNCRFCCLAS